MELDAACGSYDQAVRLLYGALPSAGSQVFTAGAGIARARELLERAGDPQEIPLVVHVAGTAGKGSVCAAIEAGLRAAGVRTGLHLSPHVYDLRERFQVDGELLSESVVVSELNALLPHIREMDALGRRPTFFEVTVALAFGTFVRAGVEVAVVETGLGGLYDATNVVRRTDKVAVITTIGLDHTEVLGASLGEIAVQKAGIIAPGVVWAIRPADDKVERVLQDEATAGGAELHLVACPEQSHVPDHVAANHALASSVLTWMLTDDAAPALAVAVDLDNSARRDLADRAGRAARAARLPGRVEHLVGPSGRRAVLDVAHNPLKCAALVDALELDWGRGFLARWVLAAKADKDVAGMIEAAAGHISEVLAADLVVPGGGDHAVARALPADEIAQLSREAGVTATAAGTVTEAVGLALQATDAQPLVVTGSFFMLSEARSALLDAGFTTAMPAHP